MEAVDEMLVGYGVAERRAILTHKYFLGLDYERDFSLDEAIASWEEHHAWEWRSGKMRGDAEAQLQQIDLHRQELARVSGRCVDFDEAAHNWVKHKGAAWRKSREAEDGAQS